MTVVFLHGRGLGPDSVEAVAPAFDGARLLAPLGGVELRRGHTWFENVRTGIALPESVAAAEQRLLAWLDAELAHGERVVLSGFSNGGALCGHLMMHHPDRFVGAALFCAPLVLPPWPIGALSGKPVFYAHGDEADSVVEPGYYRDAAAYLTGASGAQATIGRYHAGHAITPAMVDDCRSWFASIQAH